MNKKDFFDSVRPHLNLTTENVMGLDKMLDLGLNTFATPRNQLAYILATVWWETAQRVQPIKEAYWLSEDWRRRNLRYYPYYGRGLVQTTWKDNYRKIGDLIGVDLVSNPDKIMDWKYAGAAVFVAMEEGLYTGKSLDDYIDENDDSYSVDKAEYVRARRIINGTDKAAKISDLAITFEQGLIDAGYPLQPEKDVQPVQQELPLEVSTPPRTPVRPSDDIPSVDVPEKVETPVRPSVSAGGLLSRLFKSILGRD